MEICKARILSLVLIVLAFLIAPQAQAQVAKVPVDRNFNVVTVAFDSGGAEIVFVFGSKNVSGKLAICGAYWTTGRSSTIKSLAPQFLRKTKFSLNGKQLNVTGKHFQRIKTVPSDTEIVGLMTKCRATNVLWNKSYTKNGAKHVDRPVRVTY